jgi:hypothetical protein
LKAEEDLSLEHHKKYIRRVIEVDDSGFAQHDEDADYETDGRLRIVVCMSPEGSRRLRRVQYLQSDIGFKRVVDFYEFEVAGMDRDANTSVLLKLSNGRICLD